MERTGTSADALAKLSGIRRPHLSKILTRSRRCSVVKAMRLWKVTGVPIERLVEWGKIKPRRNSRAVARNDGEKCA
jgi:plasmid maintenance system antidote protein VapI